MLRKKTRFWKKIFCKEDVYLKRWFFLCKYREKGIMVFLQMKLKQMITKTLLIGLDIPFLLMFHSVFFIYPHSTYLCRGINGENEKINIVTRIKI